MTTLDTTSQNAGKKFLDSYLNSVWAPITTVAVLGAAAGLGGDMLLDSLSYASIVPSPSKQLFAATSAAVGPVFTMWGSVLIFDITLAKKKMAALATGAGIVSSLVGLGFGQVMTRPQISSGLPCSQNKPYFERVSAVESGKRLEINGKPYICRPADDPR